LRGGADSRIGDGEAGQILRAEGCLDGMRAGGERERREEREKAIDGEVINSGKKHIHRSP